MDLCEFEASLVYRVRSRTARAVTQRNPVSKNKNKQIKIWKTQKQERPKSIKNGDTEDGKELGMG